MARRGSSIVLVAEHLTYMNGLEEEGRLWPSGSFIEEGFFDEGRDRAGRRSDAVDRDEQRLLQHRREQFLRLSLNMLIGIIVTMRTCGIATSHSLLIAGCAEAVFVGMPSMQ